MQANFTDNVLTLSNELIERTWTLRDGRLYPASLRFKPARVQWLAMPADAPAPQPAHAWPMGPVTTTFTVERGREGPMEAESLTATLITAGAEGAIAYRFQLFAGLPVVRMRVLSSRSPIADWATAAADETICVPASSAVAGEAGPAGSAAATGIETEAAAPDGLPVLDILERLDLAPQHLRLTHVELRDQTDIYNELVFEREWLLHPNEAELALAGNVFIVEDPLTRTGLILLKESPLPHARPAASAADLRVAPAPALYYDRAPSEQFGPGHPKYPLHYRMTFAGHGTGPAGGLGYAWAVLAYADGLAGRTEVLQRYQRARRRFDPVRDARFLTNTWGDRSRDTRINAAFITQEILAGAALGADVTQIDDGWQRGVTSNSALAQQKGGVWEGYYAADADFWDVNRTRFPDGLEPVLARARERGMDFGLWFSPDSSHDFANWQRDTDVILHLHRTYGVNYIKIDGVKARTRLGEYRLHRFFDAVLRQSRGQVVFDLDVTAEIRPGYFGLLDAGPLFIENRYSDFHRYWPHQTLRNLWKLARYVDPLRLRAEFLNPARHTRLYAEDPLAPAACPPAYLFATVMASNPLGWFEVSNLPAEFVAAVAPLVQVWRAQRAAFFAGTIHPIGAAPDGTAWTGFLSLADDKASGYLLLFREFNTQSTATIPLPLPEGGYRSSILAGEGTLAVDGSRVTVQHPVPLTFTFARITR